MCHAGSGSMLHESCNTTTVTLFTSLLRLPKSCYTTRTGLATYPYAGALLLGHLHCRHVEAEVPGGLRGERRERLPGVRGREGVVVEGNAVAQLLLKVQEHR